MALLKVMDPLTGMVDVLTGLPLTRFVVASIVQCCIHIAMAKQSGKIVAGHSLAVGR